MAARKMVPVTKDEKATDVERLKCLLATLAKAIDGCESARDLAALSKQYRDCLSQIAELGEGPEEDEFRGFE